MEKSVLMYRAGKSGFPTFCIIVLYVSLFSQQVDGRDPSDAMARFNHIAELIGAKMRSLDGRQQMPVEHHVAKLDRGEMSYGSCGMNQQVVAHYLQTEGIECRRIGLTGKANHTVCEVYLDGRWQFFDGLDGVFIPLSLEQMLASKKPWTVRDFGGGRYKKRYKGDYREYIERCCTERITYYPGQPDKRVIVKREAGFEG